MAIYIVVPLTQSNTPLNIAVETNIAQLDRYQLQNDRGWLVKFEGTSTELSNHIGLTGQDPGASSQIGSAIIVPVSTYFGRGPGEMWEWLKVRLEQ